MKFCTNSLCSGRYFTPASPPCRYSVRRGKELNPRAIQVCTKPAAIPSNPLSCTSTSRTERPRAQRPLWRTFRLAARGRVPVLPQTAWKQPGGLLLVHARRKFVEAVDALPKPEQVGSASLEGQQYCKKLFALQEELAKLTPEDRYEQRLKQESLF